MTATKKKTEREPSPLVEAWGSAGGTVAEGGGGGAEDGFLQARVAFGKAEDLVRVTFYRKCPDSVEESLGSFEYDPDVHTEDFIRRTWGAGDYRLRFADQHWRWIGSFSVRIGEPVKPLGDAPATSTFDPLSYFTSESQKKSDQLNQVMLTILAKSGDSGSGSSEAIVALIKLQGDQAMRAEERNSVQAVRAEERNSVLLEKLIDRPTGGGGTEAVMKALELGMGVVADIKTDSEGGWVSVLRGVAKELGPALSQMMQKQAAAAGAVPPPPSAPSGGGPGAPVYQFPPPPGGGVPPPPQLATETATPVQQEDVFRGLLKRYAPIALQVAKDGAPPVEFAGSLLDSIGVSYHALFDSLQAHDLVSLQPELGSVSWKNPETGAEGPWIDEVVRLLHTRDWGLEDDSGTEGGDAS